MSQIPDNSDIKLKQSSQITDFFPKISEEEVKHTIDHLKHPHLTLNKNPEELSQYTSKDLQHLTENPAHNITKAASETSNNEESKENKVLENQSETKIVGEDPENCEPSNKMLELLHQHPAHRHHIGLTPSELHHSHELHPNNHHPESFNTDLKYHLKHIYTKLIDTESLKASDFFPPFTTKLRSEKKFHETLLFSYMDFGGDFISEKTLKINEKSLNVEKLSWSSRSLQIGQGRLLFTGGTDSLSKAFVLCVDTGVVKILPDLKEGRDLHAMTWINGCPAVIGGGNKDHRPLRSVEVLEKSHWKNLTHLLHPRYGHSATYHNSKTWVVGGADWKDSPVSSIEVFENGHWRIILFPYHLKRVGAGLVAISDQLLIIGGFSIEKKNTASVLSFDTNKETIKEAKELKEPASFSQNLWRFTGDHIESLGFRGKKIKYKPAI